MEDVSEVMLFRQLSAVTEALNRKPRESLIPFEKDCLSLSCQLRAIATELNTYTEQTPGFDESHTTSSGASAGVFEMDDHASLSTAYGNLGGRKRLSPKRDVQLLVKSASRHFESQHHALQELSLAPFAWFSRDERLSHLQPVLLLEQSQRKYQVGLRERLLLLCSCMLLAQDFRDYEERNGWTPKQDALISAILRGESPSVQQIGKHFQSFLATTEIHQEDRKKVDVGVRLGTKLNVLDALGKINGFGACLPLVIGFEVTKLLRLSYCAFVHFWTVLAAETPDGSAQQLCLRLAPWWTSCRTAYGTRFGHGLGLTMPISPHPVGRRQGSISSRTPSMPGTDSSLGLTEDGSTSLSDTRSRQGSSGSIWDSLWEDLRSPVTATQLDGNEFWAGETSQQCSQHAFNASTLDACVWEADMAL